MKLLNMAMAIVDFEQAKTPKYEARVHLVVYDTEDDKVREIYSLNPDNIAMVVANTGAEVEADDQVTTAEVGYTDTRFTILGVL